MDIWVAVMTILLLAAACWTDLRTMTIPNGLTAGFAAAGIIYHAAWNGWSGAYYALVGGAAGLLPLLLLYRFKGMGAGDVKWFCAFGTCAGAAFVLKLLLYAILIAGGLSALLLLLKLPAFRRWGARMPWPWGKHPAEPGKGAVFPFMLAVAPGFVWLLWKSGGVIY